MEELLKYFEDRLQERPEYETTMKWPGNVYKITPEVFKKLEELKGWVRSVPDDTNVLPGFWGATMACERESYEIICLSTGALIS